MYELPTTVTIDDITYHIREKGDYRVVLYAISALRAADLTDNERIIAALIDFYEEFETVEDILRCPYVQTLYEQMFEFVKANDTSGHQSKYELVDWERDEQLITSAINEVAKTEIRALPYLHWWTFIGYYIAIKDGALSHVVGIRSKLYKGKKLEKNEIEFKRENPNYFSFINSREQQEQLIKEVWNVSE